MIFKGIITPCKRFAFNIHGYVGTAKYSKRCWMEPSGYDTNITIYNTAIRNKVPFKTLRKNTVSWYCCGPTVYDSAHLGNLCSYMHFDIIRRIMENYFDLNVVMVMNITDIDDKIIAKANKLNTSYKNVSETYEKEFITNLKRFNIKLPTIKARVTDHIPEIIEFIQTILEKGYAYIGKDGSVYFSVDKYDRYGLFQPPQEDLNQQDSKSSSRDFALWKSAKDGEPSWESPWGNGRPGWHIECSTIASKFLGDQIDLHSGGVDLKFPHHENEEAQCCTRHGSSQWVNYWIHSGHLYTKSHVKMSKSLKNTISIDDFLSSYNENILRTLCLLVPYGNNIELREETIDKAVTIDKKLNNFFNDFHSYIQRDGLTHASVDVVSLFQELDKTREIIYESLSDDFNTPRAMSTLLHLISTTNSMLQKNHEKQYSSSHQCLAAVYNFVQQNLEALGYTFNTKETAVNEKVDDILMATINFRNKIRETALQINKNDSEELKRRKQILLKACDTVREDLLKIGVELKDKGKSTTWNFLDYKMNDVNIKSREA